MLIALCSYYGGGGAATNLDQDEIFIAAIKQDFIYTQWLAFFYFQLE